MKKILFVFYGLLTMVMVGCQSSKNNSVPEENNAPTIIIIERSGSNWVPNEDDIPDMEYDFDK